MDKKTLLRVLVVDDHVDTLRCLTHLFRKVGYLTLTANCCAEARAAASGAGGALDVVVSDVGLPDGDGVALLEELKSAYGIGAVAITAHLMPDDLRRYDRADIDCYLPKPTGLVDLVRVVASLGDTGKGARAVRKIA